MSTNRNGNFLSEEEILQKIYLIRGHKVMLDRDLADIYNFKAIRLREQVKRNILRFPTSFMFQLTEVEVETMVSQNAIPSRKHLGGYLPYAFTEYGVLMLANVLKSEIAIMVSIRLIEIFVRMREMITSNNEILLKLELLEKKVTDHDEDMKLIFSAIKQLLHSPPKPRTRIGFRRSGDKD